ncbi:MAG: hypothetical protein AAGH15_08945 [Myxococcota bacterium]
MGNPHLALRVTRKAMGNLHLALRLTRNAMGNVQLAFRVTRNAVGDLCRARRLGWRSTGRSRWGAWRAGHRRAPAPRRGQPPN